MNDYYFPPLIGSYLQIVRMVVLLLTVFVTPVWYLLVKNPDTLHENLHFLLVQDAYYVPLIIQLLLVELIIDVLKLASLNTPDVLSNSFSMIGALILGDFAVQARWLVPEVLVYMAFVAIANYAQHSYEMGYATKLCRMLLLILIWLFDLWGFLAGIVGTLTLMATTKPLVGKGCLPPHPFRRKKAQAPSAPRTHQQGQQLTEKISGAALLNSPEFTPYASPRSGTRSRRLSPATIPQRWRDACASCEKRHRSPAGESPARAPQGCLLWYLPYPSVSSRSGPHRRARTVVCRWARRWASSSSPTARWWWACRRTALVPPGTAA